ncbi:hypothetical protein J6590_003571 [Homalodisca vitripennis]|nr:hypothetical protein J6590_003571 [Homalodisca vitripennis]
MATCEEVFKPAITPTNNCIPLRYFGRETSWKLSPTVLATQRYRTRCAAAYLACDATLQDAICYSLPTRCAAAYLACDATLQDAICYSLPFLRRNATGRDVLKPTLLATRLRTRSATPTLLACDATGRDLLQPTLLATRRYRTRCAEAYLACDATLQDAICYSLPCLRRNATGRDLLQPTLLATRRYRTRSATAYLACLRRYRTRSATAYLACDATLQDAMCCSLPCLRRDATGCDRLQATLLATRRLAVCGQKCSFNGFLKMATDGPLPLPPPPHGKSRRDCHAQIGSRWSNDSLLCDLQNESYQCTSLGHK